MKRAFITLPNGALASAMVSDETASALGVGDRVVATRLLDLGYMAQIQPGEQGTVDYVDAHTGLMEVLMDIQHRGLARWDNHICLEPFGSEDIIDGLVGVLCTMLSISHSRTG